MPSARPSLSGATSGGALVAGASSLVAGASSLVAGAASLVAGGPSAGARAAGRSRAGGRRRGARAAVVVVTARRQQGGEAGHARGADHELPAIDRAIDHRLRLGGLRRAPILGTAHTVLLPGGTSSFLHPLPAATPARRR